MENSELMQKLKKVGKYIFIFFLVYLIIGFFLNSNYPIFQYSLDLGKSYEVFKDALTISAYFLAPAVAYVLFDDWRRPFLENKKDEIQTKINALEFKIRMQIYLMRFNLADIRIKNEEFQGMDKALFETLIEFKDEIKRLKRLGFLNTEYVNKIDFMHQIYTELKQLMIYVNYSRLNENREYSQQNLEKIEHLFKEAESMAEIMDTYKLDI